MGADPNDMSRMADRLTKLMRDKLAVKAESFPAALRRAGRRLPRRVRRDGQVIVTALEQAQNPRLARIADGAGAAKAARRIEGYLARIDTAKTKAKENRVVIGVELLKCQVTAKALTCLNGDAADLQ